jgi:mannose-1-phosphate guanylyltransferase
MAGGKGERFWPLSTPEEPKPFIKILGSETLIQQTVHRVRPLVSVEQILVILGKEHLALAREQLPQLPEQNFIVEPMGRDTAPCIGLASLQLEKRDPESIMIVIPADHYIPDQDKFLSTLTLAVEAARPGSYIVTLGIKPTRPETGYGYMLVGNQKITLQGRDVFEVQKFVEKPDFATAAKYVEEGSYYWNSGIFIWKNTTLQNLLSRYMPALWQGLDRIKSSLGSPEEEEVLRREFTQFERISIDYGILEKAPQVLMIPADFRWDDVGTWKALDRVLPLDENGNIVVGNHRGVETKGCIIYAKDIFISTFGISDLVIVSSQGKVLICHKDLAPDLKKLLQQL